MGRTDILLRVVEWLYDNCDHPCIAVSSEEIMTPLVAGEEGGTVPLADLHLAPTRVLDHPHLFLSGWASVQEATAYILTSPLSSTVVVRPNVDASQAGFVFRLANGSMGRS